MPLTWSQSATYPPEDLFVAHHGQLTVIVRGPIKEGDEEVWEWYVRGGVGHRVVQDGRASSESEAKHQVEKAVGA